MEFKVGDMVKVTHKSDESIWCRTMDEAIGNHYTITMVHREDVYYILSFMGNSYYFPATSLQPVKSTKAYWYQEAKKKNIRHRSTMTKQQLIDAVREWKAPVLPLGQELRKQVGNQTRCCHFAMEYADGSRKLNYNAPCHANLMYSKNVVSLVDDIGSHHINHRDKETYKDFVHYMLNDSPWRHQFLTKDVEKALTHGVYYDVDADYNRVVCSAVALRQGSEHYERLSMFKYLKEKGFSSNVAWCVAQVLQKGITTTISVPNGGHDVFVYTMASNTFFKFFKEGFTNKTITSYKNNNNQMYRLFSTITPDNSEELDKYPHYKLFLKEGEKDITTWVRENIQVKKEGEGFNVKKYIEEDEVIKFTNLVKSIIE